MKITSISFQNYIESYFFDPLSRDLSLGQKALCTAATLSLSTLSVGTIPLAVGLYKLFHRLKPLPLSHFLEVHQRLHQASQEHFSFAQSDTQIGRLKRSHFADLMQHKILEPFCPQQGYDHVVRASLEVALFGYLYQKYHPEVQLSEKELIVAEILAACRATDRKESPEIGAQMLKTLGIEDPPSSLMNRLVQDAVKADSLELTGPVQESSEFKRSRDSLGIYTDLKKLSGGDKNFNLKNGLTYGEFLEELDILLEEKNKLAYFTHQKSSLSKNYYQELLRSISFEEYPNLHYVLSTLGVQKIVDIAPSVFTAIKSPDKLPENSPLFLPVDADFVRKRQLRLRRKAFDDGQVIVEAAFEFRTATRKQFEEKLTALKQNPPSGMTLSVFKQKFYREKEGIFQRDIFVEAAESITIEKEGISIEIGQHRPCHNLWNLATLRFPPGTDPSRVQAFLAQVGLSEVLNSSGPEDIEEEFFNKVLQYRFPDRVFAQYPRQTPEEIYQALSIEERAIIDRDVRERRLKNVSEGCFEFVQPEIAEELWQAGGRGFVSQFPASDIEGAISSLSSIIKRGLLSTDERLMEGILGFGICPQYNMEHGSANQTFVRLVTETLMKSSSFTDPSKICLFYGHEAAERMPYAYPFDCGGMRNADFQTFKFAIYGYKALIDVKGHEMQKFRKTLPDLARYIDELDNPLARYNEVMFDRALGSHYLKFIRVPSHWRLELISALKAQGIASLNGKPLEDCILGGLDDSSLG